MTSTTIIFDLIARDRASRTVLGLGKSFDSSRSKMVGFATKGAAAMGALTAATGVFAFKVGSSYVGSLNKVQALTGASDATMQKAAKTLESNAGLYAKMGQTTGDAAGGVVELTKAGLSLHSSLKAVNATMILAKAGELSVADASTLVANSLNTFGLKAKDAGKIANQLANAANISSADVSDLAESFKYVAPIAAQSGVSMAQVNAVLAELSNSGIKASNAGTGLRKFLLSLQSPSGAASKDLSDLNVQIFDANGKMKPLSAVVGQLSHAMNGLSQEARAKALKDIFGLQGMASASVILKNGTKGLKDYTQGVNKAGAAQKLAEANSKGLAGTLSVLKASAISAAQAMYRQYSPLIDKALKPLGQWLSQNPQTAGKLAGAFLALAAAGTVLLGSVVAINAATKAYAATQAAWSAVMTLSGKVALGTRLQLVGLWVTEKVGTVVTKGMAAAQWLLNAALTANPIGLVVVGLVALGAAMVIAYKKSATFRAIVQGAFHGVQAVAGKVLGWLKGAVSNTFDFIRSHWKLLASILGGPFVAGAILVISNWGKIKSATSGAVHAVLGAISAIGSIPGKFAGWFGGAKDAALGKLGALVGWVKGLRGRITGALGNLGSLLYNAGAQLIQGLIDGIGSKIAALGSKMSSIAGKIKGFLPGSPVKEGPLRSWNNGGAGKRLMDLLIQGIGKGFVPLTAVMTKLTGYIQKQSDKLNSLLSAKADFVSGFQSFTESVFSTDLSHTTTNAAGNDVTTPATIADMLKYQAQQRHKARTLKADVARLHKLGLSNALIKQLQASGESGMAQIHTLAGGSRSQIAQLNALNRQTSTALAGAGNIAGGQLYNASIAQTRNNEDLAERIAKKLAKAMHEAGKGEFAVVKLNGRELLTAIRQDQREHGKKPTV